MAGVRDPRTREVLVLTYWGGCSRREIARRLGLTEAAVRSRLHYARGTVRAELVRLGWALSGRNGGSPPDHGGDDG